VARICLESIDVTSDESFDYTMDIYLGEVDREIEKFIAKGGRETMENTVHQESSHRMALMEPTKNGLSYHARICTRWMVYRVYEKALQRSQHDCFELFQHLSRQPGLRSSAGFFFEGYAHDWLGLGGKFQADEIPIHDSPCLPLEFQIMKARSSKPNYFTTAQGLATQVRAINGYGIEPAAVTNYFLPISKNYESVDALVFSDQRTLVLLQITLAKQHSIRPHGIQELLKWLPKTIRNLHLVFVIPETRQSDYARGQKIPDKAALTPYNSNIAIHQWRLVFSDHDMGTVALRGRFEMQEEDEDEDKEDEDEDEDMGGYPVLSVTRDS